MHGPDKWRPVMAAAQPPQIDIEDPDLPKWVRKRAHKSGGYPYDKRMDDDDYLMALRGLQLELVKLQAHLLKSGERMVILFEGRDAAGKGGSIDALREH